MQPFCSGRWVPQRKFCLSQHPPLPRDMYTPEGPMNWAELGNNLASPRHSNECWILQERTALQPNPTSGFKVTYLNPFALVYFIVGSVQYFIWVSSFDKFHSAPAPRASFLPLRLVKCVPPSDPPLEACSYLCLEHFSPNFWCGFLLLDNLFAV